VSLFADPDAPVPYRVLARKYRPQRFSELIGQDAMVTTLGHAIRNGRLAQAYLLSGVRGVGKTSTARLIAKALNCVGPDGSGGPTIDPCGVCGPCRAIAEGRFIDVLELDAASNTGVEKMRELLDGVPYAPVAARFKVYVIDEVHMLSTSSFNALLKTLEEPPAHVKFLFATTEVQKLPVTILSRCQRFDLRRIPADRLAEHYTAICREEGIEAEPEALALIARAAEGSARDGLSILDQAIAHGGGAVSAAAVADMLGLADRGRTRALMAALLEARPRDALAALRALDGLGVDPLAVIDDLLDLTHATAATQAGAAPAGRAAEESAELERWAAGLGASTLHRLWQLLLKGRSEVATAPRPFEAAEMALLRLCHAAGMPDPADLARRARGEGLDADADRGEPGRGIGHAQPSDAAPPASGGTAAPAGLALPTSFEALVRLFEDTREPVLATLLHDRVRLVRYAPPLLELARAGDLPADFASRVAACLEAWTGARVTIAFAAEGGAPTLREAEAAARAALPADPALKPLFDAFPAARLLDYDPTGGAGDGAATDAPSARTAAMGEERA
jgi:DNA polymerase-3 subunit gamma/tau